MQEIDLVAVQKEEKRILSLCINIFERHRLHYFLIGGSCLGAVRHHGFIPWDDDIDIALFREDYTKAKEVLKHELPEGYSYCDYETEVEYPYNFAKVRKDNSAMVHGGDAHLKINQGIYIDIFPLDNCPDDYEAYWKRFKIVRFLKQCIDLAYMNYYKNGKLRPIIQLPLIFVAHFIINKRQAHILLDKQVQKESKEKNAQFVANYFGFWGERERFERNWFGEGNLVPFDEMMCSIPSNYDLFLRKMYGDDYMIPPPASKRESHHDIVFFSLTSPYNTPDQF